jgi:amino acid adenylation domain-containing protein
MSGQTNNQFQLSNLQRRLWSTDIRTSHYFKRCVVGLNGDLDKERLYHCIGLVVKKHSILRTTYAILPEFVLPFQSVNENSIDFNFSYTDKSRDALTIEDVKSDYSEAETIIGGIDIQKDNPLVVRLIQLDRQTHALVILLPSIAADTFAVKNIVREIAAAYSDPDSFGSGKCIQYFHYSEWQNDLMEIGNEEAVYFWSKYEYLVDNRLSISFSRNNEQLKRDKLNLSLTRRRIDSKLTADIRRLSDMLKTDISKIIVACFSALLKQHIRKDKFTVGLVNNTRSYEELQALVGLVAQTLPVIVELNADSTFVSLIRHIEKELDKVLAWEDYFRDNSWFQLEFEYISMDDITSSPGHPLFSIEHLINVSNRFDLKLACLDFGDTLELDFYHYPEMFLASSVEIIADQFQTLLTSALENPDGRICSLKTLSNVESHRITAIFNQTGVKKVPGNSVVEIFESTVKQNADTIAIRFEGIELTYSELNDKANQVAHYLRNEHGIKPGETVGLGLPRSEKLIIAMLGILKAGGCYLPIDSSFPEGRVRFMLEDCEAKVMITSKRIFDLSIQQIVYVDGFSFKGASETVPLKVDIGPGHPVYIIYTSGSTGVPKGVAIANSSLLNYCSWFSDQSGISKQSSTLLLSSIAFDLSYTSLWTSLLLGHTLCILKETEYIESGDIIRKLIDYKIDYIKCTPSHFNVIINDPDFAINGPNYNLSLIVLGGEEINVADVEAYFRIRQDVNILHHYGPTETTIGTIAELINYDDFPAFKTKIVLGRPITNSTVYIVDSQRQLCPLGFTGEIVIAGKGLALGYVNRPDVNVSKFVANPFQENSSVYLTGDLGRWMPDGTIEFLGRTDNQIKIRGYRIELGEIENTILKNDKIRSALVFPNERAKGEARLIAYLVSNSRLSIEKMNIFLGNFLPPYMIPDQFVWLDTFPLMPNGKVDKKALVELAMSEETAFIYFPPTTALEKKMAMMWKEVLGKAKIGIRDDFFKLGGHSLKATQLISRVFKNLEFRIKLSDVFQNPTIESLLKVISNSSPVKYEAIEQVDKRPWYDASHAQKRLWFLDQFEENQSAYNMHYAYWVYGDLKKEALQMAFEFVIRRHESLRSTFLMVGGLPKLKINSYEDCKFKMEYIDLSDEINGEATAEWYSKKALNHTFSLKDGPLLKSTLLKLGEDSFSFLLTLHHIICDGWSMRLLINEIMIAYNVNCDSSEHNSFQEPLRVQYKDYAAWHNKVITGPEKIYWDNKIMDPPGLVNLPYDNIGFVDVEDEKPYIAHELDREVTQALRDLAKKYNSTLSNIIFAIYALFINKISGQADFLIGVGHANRNHADLEGLIGFFVNLLPMRVQFSEEATIESMITDITKTCIEAYDHSNYPFDLLVEKFCYDRYSSRQPLVNVMYDFKGYGDLVLENEGYIDDSVLSVAEMPALRNIPKFDITLFVSEVGDGLKYYFEYVNKFSENTANNFFKVFNELIILVLEEDALG